MTSTKPVDIPNATPAESQCVWQQLLNVKEMTATDYHDQGRVELLDLLLHPPRILLDIGCGSGATGMLIKKSFPGARIIGVEINESAANMAATRLDQILIGRFEDFDLLHEGIGLSTVDTVIVADVLEHMYDPWDVMVKLRPYLSVDAQIIASIPNTGNLLLLNELANGKWSYESAGLLDITHIRFFTRKEINRFFKETGYYIVKSSAKLDSRLLRFYEANKANPISDVLLNKITIRNVTGEHLRDLCALQFYIVASPTSQKEASIDKSVPTDLSMEEELALLRTECLDKPDNRLATTVDELAEVKRELMKLSDWATGLKSDLEENKRLVVDKHDQLVELLRSVTNLQRSLEDSNKQVATLQGELADSKSQLEEKHSRLIEMSDWGAGLQRQLEVANLQLNQIVASGSWRITKPLRYLSSLREPKLAVIAPPKSYGLITLRQAYRYLPLSSETKYRLRSLFFGVFGKYFGPFAGQPSALPPSPRLSHSSSADSEGASLPLLAEPTNEDIFFWAVIDWRFRVQRPQHLAKGFAQKGHRVFYFSNVFVGSTESGFQIEEAEDNCPLYIVNLYAKGSPPIYFGPPGREHFEQLRQGMVAFLTWAKSRETISVVQHPFWFGLAKALPNNRLVYDCMDHHDGFGTTSVDILATEKSLMQRADLLVVTSEWLERVVKPYAKNIALVRNACDYEHFCMAPSGRFEDPLGRQIIGYYGAIAEWFDVDLVEKVAEHFPDCLILLVGADTAGAAKRLRGCSNVQFIGEVKYTHLPHYLYAFDVCLLPFRIIPLTMATNPVKVYEYLSAGKPVVSVDLPELRGFENLVSVASSTEQFIELTENFLKFGDLEIQRTARQHFASRQTWLHRIEELEHHLDGTLDLLASIIVVTYNNLPLTKLCLDSIERSSDYRNYEVIIVDNSSSDGTPAYLDEFCSGRERYRTIINLENRGFSAANNQGLAVANGDYLVVLNNDTVVTPGWIRTLVNHFKNDSSIGLIGPVTNNIGNEARIETLYEELAAMPEVVRPITLRNMGQTFDIRTLAFFCVMFRRTVYEKVGPLDEAFGLGFFEDDDYCRRVENNGWRIVCAEDVFVHHHLSASFNKLKQGVKEALFEKNKKIYEDKWGKWVPHKYR